MNDLSKVRFKYIGDEFRSKGLKKIGVQKLDILLNDMEFQYLKQGYREFRNEDGTVIRCSHVFGLSHVEIYTPLIGIEEKEEVIEEIFGKWVVITANNTLSLLWDIDYNKMVKLDFKQNIVDFVKKYGYKTTTTDFIQEPSSDDLLEVDYSDYHNISFDFSIDSQITDLGPYIDDDCTFALISTRYDSNADHGALIVDTDLSVQWSYHYIYVITTYACQKLDEGGYFILKSFGNGYSNGSFDVTCHSHYLPFVTLLVRNAPVVQTHYKINNTILQYVDAPNINVIIGVDFNFHESYNEVGVYDYYAFPAPTTCIDQVSRSINSTGNISTIGNLFLFGSLLETVMRSEIWQFPLTGGGSGICGTQYLRTINSRKSVDYSIDKNDYCCPKYNHYFYLEGVKIQVYNDVSYVVPSNFSNENVVREPYGEYNLAIRACAGKLSKLDLSKRNILLEIAMKELSDRMVAEYNYANTINSSIVYLVKK